MSRMRRPDEAGIGARPLFPRLHDVGEVEVQGNQTRLGGADGTDRGGEEEGCVNTTTDYTDHTDKNPNFAQWFYRCDPSNPWFAFLKDKSMPTLFVTGGCGFIGSNFIRHLLQSDPGVRIVNFDALTYAGNLANLADVANDPRYKFVKGDIADRSTVMSALDDGVDVL